MKKAARNKQNVFEESSEKPKIVAEIEPQEKKQTGFKKLKSNKPLFIGVIIIFLIVIAAGAVYLVSYFAEDAEFFQTQEDTQKVLSEVGEVFLLPEGEVPTVATVSDIEKLSSQPFFANAQNGDKVILFGGIKQAILYRPSIKKIINMSPIDPNSIPQADNNVSTPSATTDSNVTPTPREKIKVAVLNSTQESGLARKGSDLLDEDVFDVIGTLNANGEYETTIVSVVNGSTISDSDMALILNSFSEIEVKNSTLPADEAVPAGSDVVVILGEDFSESY